MIWTALFLFQWIQIITSANSWDDSVSIPGGLISWRVSSDKVITWRMEASADGWIGLGWDPTDHKMENADMMILSMDDNRLVLGDYFSYTMSLPEKDPSQDFDIIDFGKSDGKMFMEFSRTMETEDIRMDKPITPGTLTVIWAYGNNRNGISYHQGNRGSTDITITTVHQEQEDDETEMEVATFDGGQIQWKVDGDSVLFNVQVKITGWVGIGFNPDDGKMRNADMVIVTGSDDKMRVRDYFSEGMEEPILDSSQDVEVLHMGRNRDVTYFEFRRLIDTGDSDQDKVLTSSTTVIWAYGEGRSVSYHHGTRGSLVLDLVTPSTSTTPSESQGDSPAIVDWGENKYSFPAGNIFWRSEVDQITIRVESESSGWFGIGFKPDDGKMKNADMIIASGDKLQIKDYFSEGMEDPILDNQQDLISASSGSTDGKTWLQFTRKYDTKDEQDKPILFGENVYIIYAFGSDSSVNYHSGNRGHFNIPLVTEANIINPDDHLYTHAPDGTYERDGETFEKVLGKYYEVNDDGYAAVNNYYVKHGQIFLLIDRHYLSGTKEGFYLKDGLYWKEGRGYGYDGQYYYELNPDGYYTKDGYLWKGDTPHTFFDGKYYSINSDGYSYHDGYYWKQKDRFGKKGDTYILCNVDGFNFYDGYWWKDDKRYLLVNGRYFRN